MCSFSSDAQLMESAVHTDGRCTQHRQSHLRVKFSTQQSLLFCSRQHLHQIFPPPLIYFDIIIPQTPANISHQTIPPTTLQMPGRSFETTGWTEVATWPDLATVTVVFSHESRSSTDPTYEASDAMEFMSSWLSAKARANMLLVTTTAIVPLAPPPLPWPDSWRLRLLGPAQLAMPPVASWTRTSIHLSSRHANRNDAPHPVGALLHRAEATVTATFRDRRELNLFVRCMRRRRHCRVGDTIAWRVSDETASMLRIVHFWEAYSDARRAPLMLMEHAERCARTVDCVSFKEVLWLELEDAIAYPLGRPGREAEGEVRELMMERASRNVSVPLITVKLAVDVRWELCL
ncbi:hypothetical protein PWT90_07007 [Aphanocladium album]|nr:hypothetical protein PWT90_07007 [Aphanocladium album]